MKTGKPILHALFETYFCSSDRRIEINRSSCVQFTSAKYRTSGEKAWCLEDPFLKPGLSFFQMNGCWSMTSTPLCSRKSLLTKKYKSSIPAVWATCCSWTTCKVSISALESILRKRYHRNLSRAYKPDVDQREGSAANPHSPSSIRACRAVALRLAIDRFYRTIFKRTLGYLQETAPSQI